jgi:hypothetical protein
MTLYYNYRDDRTLDMTNIPHDIFYDTLQEHIREEDTLTQLDSWLSNYRDIINCNLTKNHTPLHIPNSRQESGISDISPDALT